MSVLALADELVIHVVRAHDVVELGDHGQKQPNSGQNCPRS